MGYQESEQSWSEVLRDWVHRIARVLDSRPKSLQPKAKAALHQVMNAE